MDQKDRARHSVAQAREHFALVAEELHRRASFDWVKQQAKEAAAEGAREVVREARLRPLLVSALAAGIGAAAIFGIVRHRKLSKANKEIEKLRAAATTPVRARMSSKKAAPRLQGARELMRTSSQNALVAFGEQSQKKLYTDVFIAPVIGALVVGVGIAGAIGTIAQKRRLERGR